MAAIPALGNSGGPPYLNQDGELLAKVRAVAIKLVMDDPALTKVNNKPIADTLQLLQSGKGIWKYIS